MAADSETGELGGRAGFREHVDNPIVMLLLFTFFVLAIASVGRSVGNSFDMPGLTAFCGG